MKQSNVKKAPLLAVTLAGLLFGAGGSVSANTVTMLNYGGGGGTIDCTTSCLGFQGSEAGIIGAVSLNNLLADDYDKLGSPSQELDLLNQLLIRIPEPTVLTVTSHDGDGDGFSTNRQYFSIKKAQDIWYFKNDSGGSVSVSLNGEDYSHWAEYGAEVPIPAAAWLFGSGLIGLAGIARKRKTS